VAGARAGRLLGERITLPGRLSLRSLRSLAASELVFPGSIASDYAKSVPELAPKGTKHARLFSLIVEFTSRVQKSGAKDTRTPNASRLPGGFGPRKASGVRRVHRRCFWVERRQASARKRQITGAVQDAVALPKRRGKTAVTLQ